MTVNADMDYRRCAFAHAASLMFEHRHGLKISPKKMSEIIGTNMDDEVEDILYDPNSPYMDTCIRECVNELVSKHYLGQSWPCYMDNADIKDFGDRLAEAIENGV